MECAGPSPPLSGAYGRGDSRHREAARFRGLAVTAGVCEEIVFRGWLIAYLAAYLPVWPAAVLGGLAFGLAHAYRGLPGMAKTGATGVFTGVLYVWTGSLLWSMLIHAAIDLHGGAVGRRLVENRHPMHHASAPGGVRTGR